MHNRVNSYSKVARNSVLLYLRLIITMIINLYIVRIVINTLGIEDYGIFNVVAGLVTMLTSITSILSSSTQRFYSFYMDDNKESKLNSIFVSSFDIILLFTIITFIISESFGLWFVNTHLVIPVEKIEEANWIYQYSLFTFIVSIFQIPYMSAVIAHEDMHLFSIITIFECVIKLFFALLLSIFDDNRLTFFCFFLFISQLICFLLYLFICIKKYPECKYQSSKRSKSIRNELLSFSGWVFFGSAANVGMNQINTILVNIFFGPIVNSARAIAIQMSNAISTFTTNFIIAFKPSMIKSYAENDIDRLNTLFDLSNKFIFYCMLFICLPLFIEMKHILYFWINMYDEETILFCRLMLIYIFIMALNNPISIIIHATGKVKQYHFFVEIFTLLSVPITYLLFKMGYPPYTTFLTMIIAAFFSHIVRLFCLNKYYPYYKISQYFSSFLIPSSIIFVCLICIIALISNMENNIIVKLILEFVSSFLFLIIAIYFIGISKKEKIILNKSLRYLYFRYIKLK